MSEYATRNNYKTYKKRGSKRGKRLKKNSIWGDFLKEVVLKVNIESE